ncbi:hypothetical protein LguiB_017722 [Lonicera macranthoides]
MGKSPLYFSFLSLLHLIFFILPSTNSSSCPIDFSYIKTFPWDNSQCNQPTQQDCCQTLRSLFGMGLAQRLKDTSNFYLPNNSSSISCLSNFRSKLASSVSIPDGFFSTCLNDTTEFTVNRSSCAGIATIRDWVNRVGPVTELDSACNADLTGLTRCGLCLDASLRITSQLVALDPNGTKCFYYTILYAVGVVNGFGPQDVRSAACALALPLARSSSNHGSNNMSHKNVLKLVFGFLGALVGVILVIVLFFLYRKWDKKKKQNAYHEDYVQGVKARVLPNTGAKWFSIDELEQATDSFSQRNLIGQGGFGVVYKGRLSDGTVVAVKQLMNDLDATRDEEFRNETEIISKIRHRNLLSLRGCCASSDIVKGKRRYVVYDFMPNSSLDVHLFNYDGTSKKTQLTWPIRKNIILDIAKGLAYLHYGIKPAIYHRDIKSTNILLDADMKAKVADFGLAKQSTEGHSHLTTRVAGTYGYLAPEYALYGQLTEKSDVYSFGIIVLEIMSGRKVLDASSSSTLLITDWAWERVKSGDVRGVFDESIREEGPRGVMERFVRVGILCAHVMVALRPTIADALKMLEGDIDIPRLPDRPLPLSHESFKSSLQFSFVTNEGSSRPRSSLV